MFIRSGARAIVGMAFERAGLGIDHERYVVHRENRPADAQHLDYELFVYFTDPARPLDSLPIDEVIASVLNEAGIEGISNGRKIGFRTSDV